MNSAKQLYQYISNQITIYPPKEAQAITYMLLKHYLRLSNVDVLVDRPLGDNKIQPDWGLIIERLNNSEPVQHIIGSEEFCGLKFNVSSSVLIPRPETEELVRLITKDFAEPDEKVSILDIGTGSGCISIVLSRFLPHASVSAWDVSESALTVAKENAQQLMATVDFQLNDILKIASEPSSILSTFDCIVSNPPYVTYSEAEKMSSNVLRFEPHLALFVEDNSPTLFYEAIAKFGTTNLKENGKCYVEINEHFGPETQKVFLDHGYSDVVLIQDIHGKDRFVKATYKNK